MTDRHRDIGPGRFWLITGALATVYLVMGELLGELSGAHWAERWLYSLGKFLLPLLLGGAVWLLSSAVRRLSGNASIRPNLHALWTTIALACIGIMAAVRTHL